MISRLVTSSVLQGLPKYRSMLGGNSAYIPSSFESIAIATGTGSSGIITFSSIPSTFKHLQIRGISKSTYTSSALVDSVYIRFNSDSTSLYSWHNLQGDGSTATAEGSASVTEIEFKKAIPASGTGQTNIMGVGIIDILDYGSTSKNKTVRGFFGCDANTASTNYSTTISSGLWRSTAAISTITIHSNIVNFTTASTFALYGIKEFS